jgi:hypothetical protein
MKKFSWKTWLVIGLVAVVGAVAGVLLAVGIARHQEGTLLTVCWDEEGAARYIDDDVEGRNEAESCEGSEELVWPTSQIPITLSSLATLDDGSMGETDPRRERVLQQAVRDFDSQAGFELFRWIPAGTVEVAGWVHFGLSIEARRHGEAETTAPPGYVSHERRGRSGKLGGHIYIRSDVESSDRLLYRVLLHELGHVAGLKHDTFTASIMFPMTRDDFEGRISTAHLTDVDRARLRELYGPRGRP